MSRKTQRISLQHTYADIFMYDGASGPCEAHIMIHATQAGHTFTAQLDAIHNIYRCITDKHLRGFVPVFRRYYLSDAANQAGEVYAKDGRDSVMSVIQQPPLDGTKVALWVYLISGVEKKAIASQFHEVRHGRYSHLWVAGLSDGKGDSRQQMSHLFSDYIRKLHGNGCTLYGNCIRTWLFVNDIDNNYRGVVEGRNEVFEAEGLTCDSHFIASTGICGRQEDHRVLVQMDAYAIGGIKEEQVHYLYAPDHLNRTSEYGVRFERGTYVNYGDRRHVFISGTASIDSKGQIVFPGDIVRQAGRMLENIEALLAEAECTWGDVSVMTVYLRDIADYGVVSRIFSERFPGKPYVIVLAPVCRPGWLIETECMAVRAIETEFEDY